jgi:hypothetical protein
LDVVKEWVTVIRDEVRSAPEREMPVGAQCLPGKLVAGAGVNPVRAVAVIARSKVCVGAQDWNDEFRRAATMTRNECERALLLHRGE